jgi:hypothetical protein
MPFFCIFKNDHLTKYISASIFRAIMTSWQVPAIIRQCIFLLDGKLLFIKGYPAQNLSDHPILYSYELIENFVFSIKKFKIAHSAKLLNFLIDQKPKYKSDELPAQLLRSINDYRQNREKNALSNNRTIANCARLRSLPAIHCKKML